MDTETRDMAVDAVAGFCAGAACTLIFQPLDTVLTRQQYAGASSMEAAAAVLRRGGGLALWRGATPLIALVPVQNALLMVGYGVGERWGRRVDQRSSAPVFVGGCAGGFLQAFVASPFELAKVRRQLFGRPPYHMALATRGLHATVHRDAIPHGVWFWVYAECKRVYGGRRGRDDGVGRGRRRRRVGRRLPRRCFEDAHSRVAATSLAGPSGARLIGTRAARCRARGAGTVPRARPQITPGGAGVGRELLRLRVDEAEARAGCVDFA